MAAITMMDEQFWPSMKLRWQGGPAAEAPSPPARDTWPGWVRPAFRWPCQAEAYDALPSARPVLRRREAGASD